MQPVGHRRSLTAATLLYCCFAFALLVPASAGVTASSAAPSITPTSLQIETGDSEFVGTTAPRFSWRLTPTSARLERSTAATTQRGLYQTAYVIQVWNYDASDLLWDTGLVQSNASRLIGYTGGYKLQSNDVYQWRVSVLDSNGRNSSWSDWNAFRTALLSDDDWKVGWVYSSDQSKQQFRAGLILTDAIDVEQIRHASLYFGVLGYGTVFVNGQRIGDEELGPWTTWQRRVLYRSYNITSALDRTNAVGVWLAAGQYAGPWHRAWTHDTPPIGFRLQIQVRFRNGSSLVLGPSLSEWRVTHGPVVSSDVYEGEKFDASLWRRGWDQPGFNTTGWTSAQPFNVTPVVGGMPKMAAHTYPPIRVVGYRRPFKITEPGDHVYVAHFPENFVGVTALVNVSGPQGTEISLAHGEQLALRNNTPCLVDCREFGSNATENAHVYYPFGGQKDSIVLGSPDQAMNWTFPDGSQGLRPMFTYHGYQFVEIKGWPDPAGPRLDQILGLVIHSDIDSGEQAEAKTHPMLDSIRDICRRSLLSNVHSVESDCPTRERVGWTGDAQSTMPSALKEFGGGAMHGFYAKWIQDMLDTQLDNGGLSSTIPYAKHYPPVDPSWPTAFPQLVWSLYKSFGDLRAVEAAYPALRAYNDFVATVPKCPACHNPDHDTKTPNGLVDMYMNGDWLEYRPQDEELTLSGPIMASVHFIYDMEIIRDLAAVLNKTDDVANLTQRIDIAKKQFVDYYLQTNATGAQSFGNGQANNAVPLGRGLCPDELVANISKALMHQVELADYHQTVGLVGARYIHSVLSRVVNRTDVALRLALQTDVPSYGFMIKQNATTLFENWSGRPDVTNGHAPPSHNHHFLGGMIDWLWEDVIGIRQAEDSVAWSKAVLDPVNTYLAELPGANGSLATPFGRYSLSWYRGGANQPLFMNATVPVNARAQILLPCLYAAGTTRSGVPRTLGMCQACSASESSRDIWKNGTPVSDLPSGISAVSCDAERQTVVVDVGSGPYHFVVQEI